MDILTIIYSLLVWWALAGLGLALFLPKPETMKSAYKQWFWLGPVFWGGVLIYGIYIKFIRK